MHHATRNDTRQLQYRPEPSPRWAYAALLLIAALLLWIGGRETPEPVKATTTAAQDPFAAAVGTDAITQIRRNLERQEYQASESSRGLQAPNRAHRLRSYFEPTGVRIVDRVAPGSPELVSLNLSAWGREGSVAAAVPGSVSHDGPRIEIAHPGIVQWFINGPDGLEQGFTLAERIAGEGPLVVDIDVTGAEVLSSSSGLVFQTEPGRSLHYEKLFAEDANGNALPSRMLARAEGLRIEVDDLGATYPILIDPLLTGEFDAEVESNQQDAALGSHVSGAGDVNGDGFADILVGAEYYDEGESDEGAVFLYLGGPSGTGDGNPSNADAVFQSNLVNGRMQKGETAGDVNGDGFDDIVIGCNRCESGHLDEGLALIFLGSAGGISGGTIADADTILQPDAVNNYFARNVATAGDVNGDGYDDVLVGQAAYFNGQLREGAAFVFHGSATGIPNGGPITADTLIESNNANAALGYDVASAGDVNADGYADIIIGADEFDTPAFANTGAAFVFHGSATGIASSDDPMSDADTMIQPKQGGVSIAVSGAGDTNGDGYSDVLVGFPNYNSGLAANSGIVLLVEGSATGLPDAEPGVNSSTLESLGAPGENAGTSVAAAGDVNGDGYGDVLVGVPDFGFFPVGASAEGTVLVFLGRAGGIPDSMGTSAFQAPLLGQSNAHLGSSVASAGDVNGDGYDDVIFGAPDYDGPQSNEGHAFVFHGGAIGIESGGTGQAQALIEPGQTDARLGFNVASAGDVNGDGYDDVIVGAITYDAGETDEGAAFVFLGSALGIVGDGPATAHAQLESDQDEAWFGWSVASAGDVNRDGYGDVVVGARQYDAGETDEGAAFVFLGSPTGIQDADPGTAHAQLESDQADALFSGAASAGDINGDGYGDMVVGFSKYDGGDSDEGIALVFLGSANGIGDGDTDSADSRIVSNRAYGHLGESVASAGDVNGDGYGDIIIGASPLSPSTGDAVAHVFLGSATGIADGDPTTADATFTVDNSFHFGGTNVSSAGDVNGDGFGDVLVGITRYDAVGLSEGAAFLFLGSQSGPTSGDLDTADARIEGEDVFDELGTVGAAGDVNGDGFGDVLIGVRGKSLALVFFGSPLGIASGNADDADVQLTETFLVTSVAPAGDVNGDGLADIIAGAPRYGGGPTDSNGLALVYLGSDSGRPVLASQLRSDGGGLPVPPSAAPGADTEFTVELFGTSPRGREFAKLEVELCEAGAAFGDAACSIETPTSWTDLGTTGAFLSHDLTGLAAQTTYNWRARVLYRSVFATATPVLRAGRWRRLSGATNTTDIRVVPEPGAAAMGGVGVAMVAVLARRRSGPKRVSRQQHSESQPS